MDAREVFARNITWLTSSQKFLGWKRQSCCNGSQPSLPRANTGLEDEDSCRNPRSGDTYGNKPTATRLAFNRYDHRSRDLD
jgi:hypothetical protein